MPVSTAFQFSGWWEWEGRWRVRVLLDTLLGPEETGLSCLRVCAGVGVCFLWIGLSADSAFCGVGGGAGCFLRTAQWTRASFLSL